METGVSTRVTLGEFLANPDIHYFDLHELHNGEIVEVSPPSRRHVEIQVKLERLLQAALSSDYIVWREFYYTLPTEARRADVAVVSKQRWEGPPSKTFFGAPDLIIEILSPSNTAADLTHLRRACFANGSEQFWILDPFDKVVEIYRKPPSEWQEFGYVESSKIHFQFAGKEHELDVRTIFD